MPDEVVLAIAMTLATKSAEAVVAGGRSAVAALVRLVKGRFAAGSRDEVVLRDAIEHPTEPDRQQDLAEVLTRAMAADPHFAEQVMAHWQAARTELTVEHGAVVNHFNGAANKVVQVRDVHGDVSL